MINLVVVLEEEPGDHQSPSETDSGRHLSNSLWQSNSCFISVWTKEFDFAMGENFCRVENKPDITLLRNLAWECSHWDHVDHVQLQSVPEVWIRFCWDVLSFVKWDPENATDFPPWKLRYIEKCENLMWHLHVIFSYCYHISQMIARTWRYLLIGCIVIWCFCVSESESLCSASFGCDSTVRILERTKQVADCRREGEALAFISFSIDHACDKITQSTEMEYDTSHCILGLFPQLQRSSTYIKSKPWLSWAGQAFDRLKQTCLCRTCPHN